MKITNTIILGMHVDKAYFEIRKVSFINTDFTWSMGSLSSSLCAPSLKLDLQSSSRDSGDVRRSRVVLLGAVFSLSLGSLFTEK